MSRLKDNLHNRVIARTPDILYRGDEAISLAPNELRLLPPCQARGRSDK